MERNWASIRNRLWKEAGPQSGTDYGKKLGLNQELTSEGFERYGL
jgi:hypothetical protein